MLQHNWNRLLTVSVLVLWTLAVHILSTRFHRFASLRYINSRQPPDNTIGQDVKLYSIPRNVHLAATEATFWPADNNTNNDNNNNNNNYNSVNFTSNTGRWPTRGLESPKSSGNGFNKSVTSQVVIGPDFVSDHSKYFVYKCDLRSLCGGWADRVKGMMAAYVIANLTGRVFKIDMPLPGCDMQQLLVPNQVNWSLPISYHELVKGTKSSDIQKFNYVDNWYFLRSVPTTNFNSLVHRKATFVYYKSNFDFMIKFQSTQRHGKQLSWMKELTKDQINAAIYKRLFKPSPLLHQQFTQFLTKNLGPNEKLVCAHLRMGRNPSLPHDTAVARLNMDDLPKIWDSIRNISEQSGQHKLFLMSDSQDILADAKRQSFRDNLIFTEGSIVHVERSRHLGKEELCSGLEKVLLEQFILMHCDVLLISKSGLSRMASYVRGSDEELYCIMDGGRVVPCQNRNIQELYKVLG